MIQILSEDSVCDQRAIAVDENGQPVSIFYEVKTSNPSAKWGSVYPARFKKSAIEQGGGFAVLETGEDAFLRRKDCEGLHEGQHVNLQIVAEARRGKAARASKSITDEIQQSLFERWANSFPNAGEISYEIVPLGDERIQSAFDKALSASITLRGGGILRFAETPALIAIDIDTAGRHDRGRSYDRAAKVNIEAAIESATQLNLRGYGGNIVLDCVAPIRKNTRADIKRAFLEQFRKISDRAVDALAPSPFGLMEATVAWRTCPLSHTMQTSTGEATAETLLLASIRKLERQLIDDRAGSFALSLPTNQLGTFRTDISNYSQSLDKLYGARHAIRACDGQSAELRRL